MSREPQAAPVSSHEPWKTLILMVAWGCFAAWCVNGIPPSVDLPAHAAQMQTLAELVRAIRDVAAGGTAVHPIASQRVVRGLGDSGVPAPALPHLEPADPLTERELEVLRLMTGGYSNREIARALRVAEGTVKNHVSSILSKLGVRDRTRAVLQAARAGYLA